MARSKLTLSVSKTSRPDLGKSILSATLFTALQGGLPVGVQQPLVRSMGPGGAPEWLWPGRIQAGEVTVIEGEAGAGKSFVACDLAARFSRGGPFPAGGMPVADVAAGGTDSVAAPPITPPAGKVLFVTLQDGERVTDNRLQAMGADCERILIWGMVRSCQIDTNKLGDNTAESLPPERTGKSADLDSEALSYCDETTEERPVSFPFDLPMIEYYLKTEPAIGCVVIDPLSDFCQTPGQLDATLRKLQILARRSGVAVVVTLPAYARFDSNGGFKSSSRWKSDAARAVWCIAADPDDRQRRLFFPRRTNGMADPNGLEFRIQSGRIAWDEQSIVSFDDPLGRETEIRNFLNAQLRHKSQSARKIFQLGGERGYTRVQIRQVAKRMGINGHQGPGVEEAGEWTWLLPGQLPGHDEFARGEPREPAIKDDFEKLQAMKIDKATTASLNSGQIEQGNEAANQNLPNFQNDDEFDHEQFREDVPIQDDKTPVTGELAKVACVRVAASAETCLDFGSVVVPTATERLPAREENIVAKPRPNESNSRLKESVEPNREVKISTVVGETSARPPHAKILMAKSRRDREERRAKRKKRRQAVKKGRK